MPKRVLYAVMIAITAALPAAAQPVKLGLRMNQASLMAGQASTMTLQLLDAANRPVAATKPMTIAVQARLASGKVLEMGTVDFAAGQSEKQWSQKMPATGLMYVWAKNPELLPGGQFVNVRVAAGIGTGRGSLKAPAAVPAPALALRLPQITLRYSPQRNFLADGKDTANVEAFLMGDIESYPQDIRLNVYDSSHALTPSPLTIPAGQLLGQAELTSASPGTVMVQFLGSSPSATLQGNKELEIRFVPPITHLGIEVSPPGITLVDTADVIATLMDEAGHPLAPGTPRTVSFSLKSGRGHLSNQQVTVGASQFEARTSFTPEWPGPVAVEARTDNMATADAPVQVGLPVALLLCSAIGGAVGGFLAPRSRKKIDRYRVPVGIATGFLFYWACIFLGLAAIGHQFVLNPLSALALSAIGGWLQAKVFSVVWGAARAPQKP